MDGGERVVTYMSCVSSLNVKLEGTCFAMSVKIFSQSVHDSLVGLSCGQSLAAVHAAFDVLLPSK